MKLTDDEISEYRQLTSDLQQDLQQQIDAYEELESALRESWKAAQEKDRTADNFSHWRDRYTDQVAVGWVLTSVFVRYLEDNGLVERWLAGSQSGGAADTVADNERWYFKHNPTDSEADYLLHIFGRLAEMPAGELFGEERNPLYRLSISGDAAQDLIDFFRATDADTGELHRDFSDAGSQTRFLGDLYQNLSTDARKRYALLQTPDFVEEFILDHTLERALEDYGLFLVPETERNEGDDRGFRFIDPTCGSGHFLLGGFRRILERLRDMYPSKPQSMLVRRALETVHGVDLNPFAVSISRFRLLVAAIHELDGNGPPALKSAPDLPLQVGVGDSLIQGQFFPRFETDQTANQTQLDLDRFRWDDRFSTEDADLIYGNGSQGILTQQYHAVVGNPPYITPKDKAQNDAYREFYDSCYYKYSLVCPFYERFFQLAGGERLDEDLFTNGENRWSYKDAGYVGAIVGNNFMKRTFGQKLIEEIIPQTDLTHVIDTSGAYIPGHGTPTVMLFGRNRNPQLDTVRAALGIRGEPSRPDDPANAKIWSSIRDHIDEPGFENDFITVADKDRHLFEEHPWSLRGGGVLEAKERLENTSGKILGNFGNIGVGGMSNADPIFRGSFERFRREDFPPIFVRGLFVGENLRDWAGTTPNAVYFPYDESIDLKAPSEGVRQKLWPYREFLWSRAVFGGGTYKEANRPWFEWHQVTADKYRHPLTITFAEVATHNHFVLDRGGKVFNRTAPVIKLPEDADEEDHLELLGPLNSSTGCFWMKQVFHNKGEGGGTRVESGHSAMGNEGWKDHYQRAGTGMKDFPLPAECPLPIPTRLDKLGQRLSEYRPQTIAERELPDSENLEQANNNRIKTLREMIPLQEELDWQMYGLYGLSEDPPMAEDFYGDEALDNLPKVKLGERAFEIVLARKMERGDANTTWFERHGSTPRTDIPDRWPQWYQDLVQARIDRIDGNDEERERFVKLIEAPEFKRRWNLDDWEDLEEDALWNWLGNRLETPHYFPTTARMGENPAALEQAPEMGAESVDQDPELRTVSELARIAEEDDAFQTVAARYTGDPSFDVDALVEELVLVESVPHLPTQRHTDEGLRRRREWEEVWELQRKEDETGEQIDDIPKPPRYRKTKDFKQKERIWPNRGKLDVPKERFTEYPGAAREDEILVSWAGLNHKERARALAEHYYTAKDQWGWAQNDAKRPRLVELLAGLKDLLPWVKQWHPERLPSIDKSFGAFLEEMIQGEAVELGISLDEIEEVRIRSIDV